MKKFGVETKVLSPSKVRHSPITAALDRTNEDVRKVQKFSRHRKIDTLLIYDDNRLGVQGEITHTGADLEIEEEFRGTRSFSIVELKMSKLSRSIDRAQRRCQSSSLLLPLG